MDQGQYFLLTFAFLLLSVAWMCEGAGPPGNKFCYVCQTDDWGVAEIQTPLNKRNQADCASTDPRVLEKYKQECSFIIDTPADKLFSDCEVDIVHERPDVTSKVVAIARACMNAQDKIRSSYYAKSGGNDCVLGLVGASAGRQDRTYSCLCNGTNYCNSFSQVEVVNTGNGQGDTIVAVTQAPIGGGSAGTTTGGGTGGTGTGGAGTGGAVVNGGTAGAADGSSGGGTGTGDGTVGDGSGDLKSADKANATGTGSGSGGITGSASLPLCSFTTLLFSLVIHCLFILLS